MFGRRLVSQALQLQHLLQTMFGLQEPIQPSGQRADLVRDEFGLHKMIIVATKAGKVNLTIDRCVFCDNFYGKWQFTIFLCICFTQIVDVWIGQFKW